MTNITEITIPGTGHTDVWGTWGSERPTQRKSCIAEGREWVFYCNGSRIVWRSRIIESSGAPLNDWASETNVSTDTMTRGYFFDIWVLGSTIHTYRSSSWQETLYYRSGTLNSNGTITWGTQRTIKTGTIRRDMGGIAIDSSGYPVVAYSQGSRETTGEKLYVCTATATNGSTWGAEVLLDEEGIAPNLACRWPVLLPLAGRNMCILWDNEATGTVRVRFGSGSSWGAVHDLAPRAGSRISGIVFNSQPFVVIPHSNGAVFSYLYTGSTWISAKIRDGQVGTITKIDDDRAIAFVFDRPGLGAAVSLIGSPDGGDNARMAGNECRWQKHTATASGTLTHIRIKTGSGDSGNAKVAIYSHDSENDVPENLLAKNDSGTPCYPGWNNIALDSSVELTAGVVYWLASITDESGVLRSDMEAFPWRRAVKSTAYSGYSFPATSDHTSVGGGHLYYLQGLGGSGAVDTGNGIYLARYGKGWQEIERIAPLESIPPSSPTSDYQSVSGRIGVLWTTYADEIKQLSIYDEDFVVLTSKGYIWVEGIYLAYTDDDEVKRLQEGALTGVTGKTPGHSSIDGNYQYYVDADGAVRRIEGTLTGLEGKQPSQISINTKHPTKYCYIDSAGKERCFEGSIPP